jgi:hypothetical protein
MAQQYTGERTAIGLDFHTATLSFLVFNVVKSCDDYYVTKSDRYNIFKKLCESKVSAIFKF